MIVNSKILKTASVLSLLAAAAFSLVMIVVFYVYRRYKLLSFQSVLKGIVPLGIVIALLLKVEDKKKGYGLERPNIQK